MARLTQSTKPIVERTTPEFRRDWRLLGSLDQRRVREALKRGYVLLREDPRGFFSKVRRPEQVHLKAGLSSSLYSLRADRDLSLILTVDDDPVFGRTLVTLFRAVPTDVVGPAYRSTTELLYRDQMGSRNGAN